MNQSQRFITNQLIVEGPDCAGKTTFIEEVHRLTNYRWNIQDRSALSMLVYAKLYGRDTFFEVERLNRQIKNLNYYATLGRNR
jgi:thymidylate kinase